MVVSNQNKNVKVAVALSGGVDSSVAALLLKKEGYDLTGVYLKCWEKQGDGCSSDEDRVSAVKVTGSLDIGFEYLNFVKEYRKQVIDYFYREYKKGRTPNPDIVCNTDIKFGLYLNWAIEQGFDYIATGHYARVKKNGKVRLLQGVDEGKDQSYFLYRLDQKQLKKVLFPLGELKKSDVRKIAKESGLSTYDRPDSQGICFVGQVDLKEFLKKEIKPKKGKVVYKNGEEIGTHDGVWFYTIGQRHGFEISKYFGLPLYVIGKSMENNELIVGFAEDVKQKEFNVQEPHWISGEEPKELKNGELKCEVRIRHLGEMHKAKVIKGDKGLKVNMVSDSFGIAPGQSAVFYRNSEVLGGAVID